MIKEKILKAVKSYKDDNDGEIPFADMYEFWGHFMDCVDGDMCVNTCVSDGDSTVYATYFITEISKTIIVDWDVECIFESEQAFIDYAIKLYEEKERVASMFKKKGTIKITISGGCLQDVENLPAGWDYELNDLDN